MKQKTLVIVLLLLTAFCLSACGGISDEAVDIGSVKAKLGEIDAYKKTIVKPTPTPESEPVIPTFRDVPFGVSMEEVKQLETLAVTEEYTNALDFDFTDFSSYQMQPAYWFNEAGQMYKGGYYMETDSLLPAFNDILDRLYELYGDPGEYNYYDNNGLIVIFDTKDEGREALNKGEVSYYVDFTYQGIDIALQVQLSESSTDDKVIYDIFIEFTDFSYSDD